MNVVITGASGQVGRALAAAVPAGTTLALLTHSDVDISDESAVQSRIGSLHPEVIINAAAYTAVDRAESEPQLAYRANELGPANLARLAARLRARLIHLSTDFVFDGESSAPYRPADRPNPLNVYGLSKLAGERAVLRELPETALIIRTSWVYAAEGHNFLRTMLRFMRERGSVRVVADQIGTPTSAASVAAAIWCSVSGKSVLGIHHWSDSGVASWYDFAVAIAEEGAALGLLPEPAVVHPITTAEYPTPARRPRFSVLEKSETVAALGITPAHWRVNLRRTLGEVKLA